MIIISHPDSYRLEREYITEVLFGQYLGLEYSTKLIEKLGEVCIEVKGSKGSIRLPDVFFSVDQNKWLAPNSLPTQPLKRWRVHYDLPEANVSETSIPVIFGHDPDKPGFFIVGNEEIRLGLDVFGSTFFMLTRYEEMARPSRDEHARFPTKESLAFQEGFVERPIVNEELEILWACLKRVWPGLTRKKREYRLVLSHDVDDVLFVVGKPFKQVMKRFGGDLIIRRDAFLGLRSLRAAWGNRAEKDPANTFDFIMDVSEIYGITSTFNFMGGLGTSEYDQRYNIEEPWVRRCLRRIIQRGHYIGFHASYGSYLDQDAVRVEYLAVKIAAEKEGARQNEWGGRQHYLRWQNPTAWQQWENAGLDYDSTVGFCDVVGFRTGCCFEYPVFNLRERKRLKLRESPLVVMDDVVFKRNEDFNRVGLEKISDLSRKCKKYCGDFTLLWHNGNVVSKTEKKAYVSAIGALV